MRRRQQQGNCTEIQQEQHLFRRQLGQAAASGQVRTPPRDRGEQHDGHAEAEARLDREHFGRRSWKKTARPPPARRSRPTAAAGSAHGTPAGRRTAGTRAQAGSAPAQPWAGELERDEVTDVIRHEAEQGGEVQPPAATRERRLQWQAATPREEDAERDGGGRKPIQVSVQASRPVSVTLSAIGSRPQNTAVVSARASPSRQRPKSCASMGRGQRMAKNTRACANLRRARAGT